MVIHKSGFVGLALLGVGGTVFGCAASPPPQTPVETATAWERTECTAFRDDAAIADVLSGRAIERIEPLYAGVQSKSSSPRLQGAVLTVRPIRGATAEWLDRSLECHGVERMLGRTVARAGAVDPFVLPGSFVRINVHSAGDGFRIELVGGTMAEAREILSRTDAFLTEHKGEVMATDLSGQ
jgi:hypothetical protein